MKISEIDMDWNLVICAGAVGGFDDGLKISDFDVRILRVVVLANDGSR